MKKLLIALTAAFLVQAAQACNVCTAVMESGAGIAYAPTAQQAYVQPGYQRPVGIGAARFRTEGKAPGYQQPVGMGVGVAGTRAGVVERGAVFGEESRSFATRSAAPAQAAGVSMAEGAEEESDEPTVEGDDETEETEGAEESDETPKY